MPAPIHPTVRDRARELYEDQGYSPEQIVERLSFDLLAGELEVPVPESKKDEVRLPNDRSTINKWAKDGHWKPWREAKKKVDQKIEQDIAEGEPFAISGIKDPIWHLSILEVQRYIGSLMPPYGEFNTPLYTKTDHELVLDVMTHVNETLRPGPRVLVRLRPVILHTLKRKREVVQWFNNYEIGGDNPPFPSDPMVPSISEVWEERLKDKRAEEDQ
jgi:hypothetical protein